MDSMQSCGIIIGFFGVERPESAEYFDVPFSFHPKYYKQPSSSQSQTQTIHNHLNPKNIFLINPNPHMPYDI